MAGILKVDQIAEANSGQGVRLNHALKNSSGTEIMSAAGSLSSNVQLPMFVGMIAAFAMPSAPSGWLVCNGAEYAIADYGDLYAVIGTVWGGLKDGNQTGTAGTTHFVVPDLRGAFLRGTSSHGTNNMGGGGDFVGPSVGSFENDQIQNMRAWSDGSGNAVSFSFTGSDYYAYGVPWESTGGGNWRAKGWHENGEGTPRVGGETRPFNAGINYCIKY